MNNFGMNPMGFNPMLMNNMGMVGINNQQNLMDENAMRIKNIVQPYENKIKELEEIIRQKDFEIAVLKDKLYKNGVNFQNQDLINLNPMNMAMQNPNKKIEIDKGQKIMVTLLTNVDCENYFCYEYEMTYRLFDRIYPNLNVNYNLNKFTLDGKKLNPFLTIKENGIYNGCKIENSPAKNITFKAIFPYDTKIIVLDEDFVIKKAIKYYLLKIGKKGFFNQFIFIYNGKQINIEDKTPIKEMFKSVTNPDIQVKINKY